MPARSPIQQQAASVMAALHRGFDATSTWVTELSWWKFFLFAMVSLIAANILQDELFSGSPEEVVVRKDEDDKRRGPQPTIVIDDSGIHFKTNKPVTPIPPLPPVPDAPGTPGTPDAAPGDTPGKADITVAAPDMTSMPDSDGESVHIELPPQIGEELSNAIEMAVENKAEAKVTRYHKQASTWFISFVSLLILALLSMKALVGGKKRAEAETVTANAAAERESMQRQLSETKMQMMQAQVEPHFLFNTLASVEYLIETDPPRASAMQRSLIQYLRAVLPQMRDNAVVTNLGREADMVKAYLNLLKMRMEERLTVDMQIPDGLRSAAFPPMMLQSMVENAIKHGLECKAEGGTLRVMAEVASGKLRVIVSDDGVGFGVMPSDGTGLGLPTIRERLKLLHGDAGKLHIAANSPSGVIATIEVPYQVAAGQAGAA
ncbi:histidine kinase [Massilia sp. PAMC28688]|uniref:sensor histidine kinase n=1 Tax=Massilia sp. PAMC28688 TaxID=2861283 RepID=UPI001C627C69|nr:histidine kinase [Massilia sp. PAMC28688]QYF93948.1 histidine kinase [Massilia sp. PAMC28688]